MRTWYLCYIRKHLLFSHKRSVDNKTNLTFSNPNQGPHQVPIEWPEYDPEDGQRYLIESVQPWIEEETTEFIEEMNWYLYDFWPLIRPAWDVNSTEIQSLDVASEEQQEPITEEGQLLTLNNICIIYEL